MKDRVVFDLSRNIRANAIGVGVHFFNFFNDVSSAVSESKIALSQGFAHLAFPVSANLGWDSLPR